MAAEAGSVPDEDARLTDFVPDDGGGTVTDEGDETATDDGPGGPADGDATDAAGEAATESVGEADDPDSVDDAAPAVSTADWTPGGGPCESCEAVVERRWRDDGGLVCGDCKDW